MKSTMTISLDKSLKEKFTDYAISLWTNPTNLLNMIIVNYIKSPTIIFKNPLLENDIEDFSDKQIKELMNDKSVIKNTKTNP